MLEVAGCFVPIVTPFTDDGSALSEVRLSRLLRHYLDQQVAGIAIATETGEFGTLTLDDRKCLVEWAHRSTQNSLPMLVNISTLSTSLSLDLAQHAGRHGARAAILIPPYFGTYTCDELVAHVQVIANHSAIPIIVVDPDSKLEPDAGQRIARIPNVHLAWYATEVNVAHADWFRCYGLQVSPVNTVQGADKNLFLAKNHAAVAKALLLEIDLEMGPPRMPVLPIPLHALRNAA